MSLLLSLLAVALTAAPWLCLGLVLAGLIKAWLPETALKRWLGGQGWLSLGRAALIGLPLPLCSCGAIPTALALHRGGAGRGPTTAFMVSTPSVGIDSLLLSYALLGPVFALARVIGAITTAILTGRLVSWTSEQQPRVQAATCCAGHAEEQEAAPWSSWRQTQTGLRYAWSNLLDDISGWMFAGLLLAGVLMTWLPPALLADQGQGLWVLVLMALIGIPLYICAAAATPIAAALLVAGLSPGAVLVFLLAGPVTSLATLAILKRELGWAGLGMYGLGVLVISVALGWGFDLLLNRAGWDGVQSLSSAQELLPLWLEAIALLCLVFFALRPLRRRLLGW